jgi:hypothetical protein
MPERNRDRFTFVVLAAALCAVCSATLPWPVPRLEVDRPRDRPT